MDSFSSLLFLIIALCADSFTASFVYGAGCVRIPWSSACIITALSSGILSGALLLGAVLRPFLPQEVPVFLSACLLILLGCSKATARPTEDMARHANRQEPEILSPAESFFLGIGLSLDNAAAGLGAGLSGNSFPMILLLSLVLSLLSVKGGCFLGKKAAAWVRVDFSKYSGFILVVLGLLKLAAPAH